MTFRFFPPAHTDSRAACWSAALCVLIATFAGIIPATAQQSGGSPGLPGPSPTPKPQAYIRFLNMLGGPKAPQLLLLAGDNHVLGSAEQYNFYTGYQPIPPATYMFTVRRADDANAAPLKRVPVAMAADVYVTLLAATDKAGNADVQLLDDTINPKTDDGLGKVVVRQFFPGALVTASIGGQPGGAPVGYGEAATLEHLPIQVTPVTLQATGMPQGAKTWNLEADFVNGGHHMTVLVFPDPYGRFRPRVITDGLLRKQPDVEIRPVTPGTHRAPTGGG